MRQRITMVGVLAAGLALAACGGQTAPDSAGVSIDAPVDAPAEDAAGGSTDPAPDPAQEPATDPDAATPSPEPDPDRLADPCAEHEGREDEGFLDVVAPVDEQVASGSFELVGCANVFEANVVWTMLDGDGRTLDEGFTTAECGTGCVGAFRDTIALDAAAGEPVVYLQVFSPNVSDEGPDQLELTEVLVVIE